MAAVRPILRRGVNNWPLSYYYERKMVFNIKSLDFKDIKALVYDITDKFNSLKDEFGDVSVISKYKEANEIIKEFICIGYDIASLEIHKEEFEEYWDEYIISISKEDNIPVIWCEKFKRDNGYLNEKSSITYVLDNCNSKCLEKITSPIQYEVSIGMDDEVCRHDDCKHTELSTGDDGKTHGFTQSWSDGDNSYFSRSFYSTDDKLVKSMMHEWKL